MNEPEIFDLIVATNRVKDRLERLESIIGFLAKPMSQQLSRKYLDSDAAAKILKISKRTLAKIRAEGAIPFIKVRRRIIYAANDIEKYLENNCNR